MNNAYFVDEPEKIHINGITYTKAEYEDNVYANMKQRARDYHAKATEYSEGIDRVLGDAEDRDWDVNLVFDIAPSVDHDDDWGIIYDY